MTSTQLDFSIDLRKPVTLSPPAPFVLRVPDTGQFVQAMWDFETEAWDYKPRSIVLNYKKSPPENSLPDTVPMFGCKPNDFMPLNRGWQVFWFDLLRLAAHGTHTEQELMDWWGFTTRDGCAFTDNHSAQAPYFGADYIQGLNLGNPPLAMKCLTTGGNLFKVITSYGKYWQIEALDMSIPPPVVTELLEKPWLIHWATQSTVIETNYGWKVIRFPKNEGGTPFPFISMNGIQMVEQTRVKPVENGTAFSPYNS